MQDSRGKKVFESLVVPSDKRFATGSVPTVESPVCKDWTGAVLASLTFYGG